MHGTAVGRGFRTLREDRALFGGAVKRRRVQLVVRGKEEGEGTSSSADLPGAIVPLASLRQQCGGAASSCTFTIKRCWPFMLNWF